MEKVLELYVFKLFFASEICRFCHYRPFARKLSFPKNSRRHSSGQRTSGGHDRIPHRPDPSKEGPFLQITVIVRDDPRKEP